MGFPSRSLGTQEDITKPTTCPFPCRLNGCPGPEDLIINVVTDGILDRLPRLGPAPDRTRPHHSAGNLPFFFAPAASL